MWWVQIVCYFFLIITICTTQTPFKNEPHDLANILFDNLRADPKLNDAAFFEKSKEFIDETVGNFMQLMLQNNGKFNRNRRSLEDPEEFTQKYILDFNHHKTIASKFVKLVIPFEQQTADYILLLESENDDSQSMVILKEGDGANYTELYRRPIINAQSAAVFQMKHFTFIVIAESFTEISNEEEGIKVFKFSLDEILTRVQTIPSTNSSSVSIWKNAHGVFMSLSQRYTNNTNTDLYNADALIYKWRETYFDVVQPLRSVGPGKITPFSMQNNDFIALANSDECNGYTKAYSTILKYDVHIAQYVVFQKILSCDCRDIKYFNINQNKELQHFLIVVNNNKDNGEDSNEAKSVIYKFIGDYFIPFQSLPLSNVLGLEPIVNKNNEVIVVASTTEGVQLFEYNGWHFLKMKYNHITKIFSTRTRSVHCYNKNNKTLIGFVDENQVANIYQVSFSIPNQMMQVHDDLLNWCTNNLIQIATFENLDILSSEALKRGDLNENIEQDERDEVMEALKEYTDTLNDMEKKIAKSMRFNKNPILKSVTANNVVIENGTFINSLNTKAINQENLHDLLENSYNINEGFNINNPISFQILFSEESLKPQTLNGVPSTNFLSKNDNIIVNNFFINGTATLRQGATNLAKVNDMRWTEENILINNKNQSFTNMYSQSLKIKNLQTQFLNKLNMGSAENRFLDEFKLKNIANLHTNNIAIGGFLNGVDLSSLEKLVLKKSGNQNITATYFFDSLTVKNFNVKKHLSDIEIPDDLLSVKTGSFYIPQTVIFNQTLNVKNMTVFYNINNIDVDKHGHIDMLLKDSIEEQELNAQKVFRYLNLDDLIMFKNKINSKSLENMNPFITVDKEIIKDRDVIISGNLLLLNTLRAKDIVTESQKSSLLRVQRQGLKLEDTEISVHMTFTGTVNSNEIFADKVNNVEPRTWVVNINQTQIIQGWKQFKGDLTITGSTNVFKINDVDIPKLEAMVLKIQDNQIVTSQHRIQNVTALKGIFSNTTLIGKQLWEKIVTINGDDIISGTTVVNANLMANNITANNLEIVGRINNISFTEVENDVFQTNTKFKVFGHKNFTLLTVNNLNLKNTPDIVKKMEDVSKNQIRTEFGLRLDKNISINSINFTNYLHNINTTNFKRMSIENNNLTISGDEEVDKIVVFGTVFINSSKINEVNLSRIVEDTIKNDEPFEFKSSTIIGDGVIVLDKMNITGNIEKLDFGNIFASKPNTSIISRNKVFHQNVSVNGILTLNDTLNGFEYLKFCQFSDSNAIEEKTLIIQGNAIFAKGPNVFDLNGNNIQNITNNVWFRDRPMSTSSETEFKNISCESNLAVKGSVDKVDLKQLSENYFSKSKPQHITAKIEFLESVTFEKNISVPQLEVEGNVNDIDFGKFVGTALLNDTAQTFENVPYIETLVVEDLIQEGEYLVNGLSLENDVMRYDKVNTVIGAMFLRNSNVSTLKIGQKVKVQNVGLIDFLENSVLTKGTIGIPAKKSVDKVNFKGGISVRNFLLNNREFNKDAVLLKNEPQQVTGRKSFAVNLDDVIYFKALKIKGFVNDEDLIEMLNHQAYKNHDNIFKSRLDFQNQIKTNDLHIQGTFNDINVTQLVQNISSLNALENLVSDYNNLLDISNKIQVSIYNQAFDLKYYKYLNLISGIYNLFGITCGDDVTRMISLVYTNGSNLALPYEWDNSAEQWTYQNHINIDFCPYPTYIKPVTLRNKSAIYIESEVDPNSNNGQTHIGKIIHFLNAADIEDVETIAGNGTSFITSFQLQPLRQDCLAFVNNSKTKIIILCDDTDDGLYLLQEIHIEDIYAISFEVMDNEMYLIISKSGAIISEPTICIWKYDLSLKEFKFDHHIYEGDEPKSLTTITFNGITYMAVGYGRLANTMHLGRISIRRFNKNLKEFEHWQNINLNAPINIKFDILPSNELVLYVLTEDTSEPLNIYIYEGISGFRKKFAGSTLELAVDLHSFSTSTNQHFVIAQHDIETFSIIKAEFKGQKWNN